MGKCRKCLFREGLLLVEKISLSQGPKVSEPEYKGSKETKMHLKLFKCELTLKIFSQETYTLVVAPHNIYMMDSLWFLCRVKGKFLLTLFLYFHGEWSRKRQGRRKRWVKGIPSHLN